VAGIKRLTIRVPAVMFALVVGREYLHLSPKLGLP
jgi:hypothetical protein